MNELLNDIKNKLNIELYDIHEYTDGTTDSLVISINNKYLIKRVGKEEYFNLKEFYKLYNGNYFQNVIYSNDNLCYYCFDFINGKKINKVNNLNPDNIIDTIYEITNSYKPYNKEFYGYLEYPYKIPYEFLKSEIDYAKEKMIPIKCDKVYDALNKIKKYDIPKYLLHGDFGVHNFIFQENNFKVIDPMPLVFDPLYDFYFASLSSSFLFMNLEKILSYYDRPFEYKKYLFLIVFYIRMSRSYMYDKEHFEDYVKIYKKL